MAYLRHLGATAWAMCTSGMAVLPSGPRFAKRWHHFWCYVVDFGLALWIVRAPIAGLALGSLLLCGTIQAQDLFLGVTDVWSHVKFFLSLILIWAIPTDYAAHILLITDDRYLRLPQRRKFKKRLRRWIPPVLGSLVFAAVLAAVLRVLRNIPVSLGADRVAEIKVHLHIVMVGLGLTTIAFWSFLLLRRRLASLHIVRRTERALGRLLRPVRERLPPIFALRRVRGGPSAIKSNVGLVFLALMSVSVFWPILAPLHFAAHAPLAIAVPVVIGAWIPWISVLTGLGRRLHTPLLTFKLLLLVVLPLAWSADYAVRLLDPKSRDAALAPAGDPHGIDLTDAVKWWKEINCDARGCPRPIIVAAAGGASRAGFFTASTLGQLLEGGRWLEPARDANGQERRLTPADIGPRLFAFSTVSGSSLAATMAVSAMAASRNWEEPCRQTPDRFWNAAWKPDRKIDDWRSCLEALVSGDFLTPVFTGLMFRDSLHVLHLVPHLDWPDRGTLLERSWEERFDNLISPEARQRRPCGLKCPFLGLAPTPGHWVPLLVLNSTSVATGHRIITTALNANYTAPHRCPHQSGGKCVVFSRSFRFHDLMNAQASDETMREIRVSTAAHNSARFPLVSPPAEIRDSTGRVVDRIVDGGYFENFGAQTATELAEAIMAVDPTLKPFVLVLSNRPELDPECKETARQNAAGEARSKEEQNRGTLACSPPRVEAGSSWLSDLSDPAAAFLHTRNARGELAKDELRETLDRDIDGPGTNVAFLGVSGERREGEPQETREISMSWWLSKPLQQYLHDQSNFDGFVRCANGGAGPLPSSGPSAPEDMRRPPGAAQKSADAVKPRSAPTNISSILLLDRRNAVSALLSALGPLDCKALEENDGRHDKEQLVSRSAGPL